MISFVLGNGKSRLSLDINHLKQYGKVYGCNAIYRDESVDCLIAVDPPMAQEIIDSGTHLSTKFYTRRNKRFNDIEHVNFPSKHLGWSSGPTALWIASQEKPSIIVIAGFDYASSDDNINNVYSGTPNYKPSESTPTYFGNWIKQTQLVVRDNPDTKYYRIVNNEHRFTPKELLRYSNFSNIKYEKLDDLFKTSRFEPIS